MSSRLRFQWQLPFQWEGMAWISFHLQILELDWRNFPVMSPGADEELHFARSKIRLIVFFSNTEEHGHHQSTSIFVYIDRSGEIGWSVGESTAPHRSFHWTCDFPLHRIHDTLPGHPARPKPSKSCTWSTQPCFIHSPGHPAQTCTAQNT